MDFGFSCVKDSVGQLIKMVCEHKRKLYYSVRVSITVIIGAAIYTQVIEQLKGFDTSVICAATTVLPTAELHVGRTLNKVIINIVANILGELIGYGLCMFSEHEMGKAKFVFLLLVIFALIVLGILLRFVKMMEEMYDYGTATFLLAMLVGALHPTKELYQKAAILGIAYALIILSSFLPPFWAGVDIHYRVQEYLDALTGVFNGLDEECFGDNFMYENLLDKPFLQLLKSLIDSKEKESSLNKFVSWELPWRHLQQQYEKIGDISRSCASAIYSLSTYLSTTYSTENLHSTQLREICKEMCFESAEVLTQLSLSMKHKTTPAASLSIRLTYVLKLASHLENTIEAKDITSRLVESVVIIKKLAVSIEELADLVPFKQSEHDSNVPELVTGLVYPVKKWVHRLFALKKKFKIKRSSVLDGSDTTQPPVNLVPIDNSEPQVVAIDINTSSGPV